jgi:hypothetical protein
MAKTTRTMTTCTFFSKSLHQLIYQRLNEDVEAGISKGQILKRITQQEFEVKPINSSAMF